MQLVVMDPPNSDRSAGVSLWLDSALLATNSALLPQASLYSTMPFLPLASQLLSVYYLWPFGSTLFIESAFSSSR